MSARSPLHHRLIALALSLSVLALAPLLLGCPASLPEAKLALDEVELVGSDHVDDDDVIKAIESDPTHKALGLVHFWWVDYGIYDKTSVEKDLKRVERFYRARGYYEARVRAGRVLKTGDRHVKVQIVVEEGTPVLVGKVATIGLEGLPKDAIIQVNGAWKVRPGDVFDEDEYRKSGSTAERALTDLGYAHAAARTAADVDLVTHRATLYVEFKPGPPCTFGDIRVTGLKEIPERQTRLILDIKQGNKYSTRAIREAQNALFDLGVFDSVTVEPDLSDPNATVIPLVVSVTEAKLRRLKAGPGFLLDPLRNDLHIYTSWENRNLFGGLRQFKYELRPMLMFKPGFFSTKEVRPGFSTGFEFRQPTFIEGRTTGSISATTGILPDPVNEFQMFSTRASIGVDRRFMQIIYGGLFYRKGWDFPSAYNGIPLPASVCVASLNKNGNCNATIGYFELLASVDTRDDLLRPHHGFYSALSLQYAMEKAAFFGGDFGDLRLQPEVRFFAPMARGLTLAFRLMTGFVIPRNYDVRFPARRAADSIDPSTYANDTGNDPPLWRTFFSGGATSNRGYPVRQVGLRDCQQRADGGREVGSDCSVTIGGASIWESSVELRFDIVGDLSGVVFVDGSDVSRNVFDIRLDFPHLSTGPGLRYNTPVGPIRVDFGWRIPGLQHLGGDLDVREQPAQFSLLLKGPFALHLSIGEAF